MVDKAFRRQDKRAVLTEPMRQSVEKRRRQHRAKAIKKLIGPSKTDAASD